MWGIDIYYLILVIPAVIFAAWAQAQVSSTFNRYSKIRTSNGMTGEAAARAVLEANGVTGVQIARVAGNLTDHFDPSINTIKLSENVFDTPSVAAVGVAAHEAGHAVQYAKGYGLMKLRAAIIPLTQIGSKLSFPLLIAGIILSYPPLLNIGIAFFGVSTLFQLVTLPVEFNASSRALEAVGGGMLEPQEAEGARKTLRAAALTYVAALAVSLMQLLRLVIRFGGRDND